MGLEEIKERFALVLERIHMIQEEETVAEPYRSYFKRTGAFIEKMAELYILCANKTYQNLSLEELKKWNYICYEELLEEKYKTSYANPAYAVKMLGEEFGALFTFLTAELRGLIVYAVEQNLQAFVIYMELYMELYNMFEEDVVSYKKVKEAFYWFNSDYCDVLIPDRVREIYVPKQNFVRSILIERDLSDPSYLYLLGTFISDKEIALARSLQKYEEIEIDEMADQYVKELITAFQKEGCCLEGEVLIGVYYPVGWERMLRYIMLKCEQQGIQLLPYQRAVSSVNTCCEQETKYVSNSLNPQYEKDHRFDYGIYLDKAFLDRKLVVTRGAYEEEKEWLKKWAGTVKFCFETEQLKKFQEKKVEERNVLDEKQIAWKEELNAGLASLKEQYISMEKEVNLLI